ncbi:MAG: aldehyde ferredoxin oxidoreductase family protein [Dehalococcoidales bacterium]|nr:aldehyde ferredoxin oxidoreductase family protein [Dehalococcoidales bacterium]
MTELSRGGYTGKILRVNLTDKTTSIDEQDEKFYRRYFGGTALIGYYLLKELKPGIDPLGPDNKLIFTSGVITGTPCAGSGRSGVGSKSPLTNGWGDSQAGGFWPAELKRAGWDAIIIEGKSDKPVYLWINDDKVEFRDASHLWGKATLEAEQQIQTELDDKRVRVAQIGPAGENLVRFASICNDITHAYGRNGHGAVMGSKMLRAIAVRGHKGLPLANPEKVREVAKWLVDNYKTLSEGLTKHGTSGGVAMLNEASILPTRNFQEGQFDGYNDIAGPTMTDTILVGRDNCYACPIDCKREVEVGAPYNVNRKYGGPEYETIASLGSLCGVNDLKAVAKGNEICNAQGMDTIAAGNCIAFAMECFERGILTKEDTDGVELKFGNAEAMMLMLEKITKREGLGNLLAEGTKRAAEQIGHGASEYAMQIKGQELPMHEPRGKVALGIGYAISPTGADHVHNMHDSMFAVEGPPLEGLKALGIQEPLSPLDLSPAKVRMFKYVVDWRHFQNCAVICGFPPFSYEQISDLVNGATGWNTSVWELMKVGERALALARAFNAREGYTAKDDILPERFYQSFSSGPLMDEKLGKEDMQKAIKTYYKMAGWDPELAVPTAEKLEELDIAWVTEELEKSA